MEITCVASATIEGCRKWLCTHKYRVQTQTGSAIRLCTITHIKHSAAGNFAIGSGRHRGEPPEDRRKVALILEACGKSYLNNREIG